MSLSKFPPAPTYYLNVPTFPPVSAAVPTSPAMTGLAQWLEADSGLNLGAGTWLDQSGAGNNCTAAIGSPVLNVSSLNGHPGITLDGSSYLRSTTADPVSVGSDREIYFIIKPAGVSAGLFASWRLSAPGWIADGRNTGANIFAYDDGVAATATGTGFNYVGGTGYIVRYKSSVGSKPSLSINGVSVPVAGSNVTADSGVTGFTLGCYYAGALGLVGDFIGTLVYNRIQSAPDEAQTTAYLRGKYGV